MVLSGSSRVSQISSLSNQNQGGGNKKAGLPIRSHYLLTHNPRSLNTLLNNNLSSRSNNTCSGVGNKNSPRC